MYLLDTCVISDFIKSDPLTLTKIKGLSPSLLFLSSISCMEIMYGFEKNPEKAKKIQPTINDFINDINLLDFTTEDAKYTAGIRHDLARKGLTIGHFDLLIAGMALSRNLVLVTSNLREFRRVPGLSCENWRAPQTVT